MKEICQRCNSTKYVFEGNAIKVKCSHCNGTGYVDWIEQIVGSNRLNNILTFDIIFDTMAQDISDSIDKEIIENLKKIKINF